MEYIQIDGYIHHHLRINNPLHPRVVAVHPAEILALEALEGVVALEREADLAMEQVQVQILGVQASQNVHDIMHFLTIRKVWILGKANSVFCGRQHAIYREYSHG